MSVIYVQTSGKQQVGFNTNPTPIPGLTLTIPAGAGDDALVTLNVPNPYGWSESSTYNAGGWFGISVDGTTLPTVACFSYQSPRSIENVYRWPTTLVVAVPLTLKPQKVAALWRSLGMYLVIDTPASLSAIIA